MPDTIVYLSLGSNQGNRLENLQSAKDLIQSSVGNVLAVSGIYETPPVGFTAETDFYNLCLSVSTSLSLFNLLEEIQTIERRLGRLEKSVSDEKGEKLYSSRNIDIDIIFYGNTVLESDNLTVPHAQFRFRKFVLVPLNDIAGEIDDPVTKLSVNELAANCENLTGDTQLVNCGIS